MACVTDNESLQKIYTKVHQLQTSGLAKEDRNVVGDRLKQVWLDLVEDPEHPIPHQTKWRKRCSQNNYRDVQNISNHLFLAFVLAIPPTICSSPQFRPVFNYLIGLGDYKAFGFTLNLREKEIFELPAKNEGYAESPLYLEFMRKIFPEPESRQIQYAYGLLPHDALGLFLETIRQGIYNSNQWDQERSQGGSRTGCLTILIPRSQDQDGSCSIRVDRKTLMQAINKFKMTELRLE